MGARRMSEDIVSFAALLQPLDGIPVWGRAQSWRSPSGFRQDPGRLLYPISIEGRRASGRRQTRRAHWRDHGRFAVEAHRRRIALMNSKKNDSVLVHSTRGWRGIRLKRQIDRSQGRAANCTGAQRDFARGTAATYVG